MNPPPKGWPRIAAAIYYDDPAAAIDWLCEAFGFEVRLKIEGAPGQIVHSELQLAGGLVMVADANLKSGRPGALPCKSPRALDGANTQSLCVCVDDVDAHCERARAAGATIAAEPSTDDYGEDYWSDRSYQAIDPEGHRWWFLQRLRG